MAEFNADMEFDRENNIRKVADTNVVTNSHHYCSHLVQTLELTDYVDGARIIKEAGEEVFFKMFSGYLAKHDVADQEKLGVAADMYRKLGFGTLDFSGINEGRVFGRTSHFASAWLIKFDRRVHPCCHFTSGYIAGVYRAITGKRYKVEEAGCIATGAEKCAFTLTETHEKLEPQPLKNVDFTPQKPAPVKQKTTIDEERIIDAMSDMKFIGNEEGLVSAFGVYLATMPSDFYNRITYNFERELQRFEMGLHRGVRELLIYAGVVCGLNTIGGLMRSQKWTALVEPMIKNKEDKIYGMTAVANVRGCGKLQVMDIVPGKELVTRVYNSYEALGYLEMFGRAGEPKCYTLTGAIASMMELAYTDEKLQGKYDFIAEETNCVAKGGPYCEFVVRKNE